jgi:hypothetical protein
MHFMDAFLWVCLRWDLQCKYMYDMLKVHSTCMLHTLAEGDMLMASVDQTADILWASIPRDPIMRLACSGYV